MLLNVLYTVLISLLFLTIVVWPNKNNESVHVYKIDAQGGTQHTTTNSVE